MEKWQKQYLTQHLAALVETTHCNTILLARLQALRILSAFDIEKINGKVVSHDKSYELYQIVQTKTKGYETLIKALVKCNQSGAAKTLLAGFHNSGIMHSLAQCNIFPDYNAILNSDVLVTGNNFKWQDFIPHIRERELKEILDTGLYDNDYSEYFLFGNRELTLVNSTIPPAPHIYIHRWLSNRVKLKPDLFKQQCTDIFVFKGIDRLELTELAQPNTTSTSQKQLDKVTSRFILLENELHWPILRQEVKTPIHLIKTEISDNYSTFSDYGTKSFILEESHGLSLILPSFIVNQNPKEKLYISEEELAQRILNYELLSGLCISETPGMGKTFLLANLAQRVALNNKTDIIAYITLSNFIDKLGSNNFQDTPTYLEALDLVFQHISPNPLSRAILLKAVAKKSLRVHFFFDGFDEVPHQFSQWTLEFLKVLADHKETVKLYVTSRPHHRHELEQALEVIAYDIRPFDEQNQINYLVDFWKKEIPSEKSEKLQKFATLCLNQLKTSITKEERDIMGIPLQCHLLGVVNLKQAKAYSHPKWAEEEVATLWKTNSIFEMYKNYFDHQYSRWPLQNQTVACRSIKNTEVKHYHNWKALQVIFPEVTHFIVKTKSMEALDNSKEIFSLGILESRWNVNSQSREFVHRTLAEFLVAEVFTNFLTSQVQPEPDPLLQHMNLWSILKVSLFSFTTDYSFYSKDGGKDRIDRVLIPHAEWEYHKNGTFDIPTFKFPLVVYFINEFLSSRTLSSFNNNLLDSFFSFSDSQINNLFICCIVSNSIYLLNFLSKLFKSLKKEKLQQYKIYFQTDEKKNICVNRWYDKPAPSYLKMCCVAAFSNATMLQNLYVFYNECLNTKIEAIYDHFDKNYRSPLYWACERGDYELFEILVDQLPLEDQLLLHCCCISTYDNPKDIIKNKLLICNKLLQKNPSLISEKNSLGQGVLTCGNIHLDIIKLLVGKGTSKYAYNHMVHDSTDNGILMRTSQYMSPEDFLELVRFLIVDIGATSLFKTNIDKDYYPVHVILRNPHKLKPETIKLILSIPEMDVNETEKNGRNLLVCAVEGQQDVAVLRELVRFGADYNCKGILDTAARGELIEIASYLISLGIDRFISMGDRPLHVAAYNPDMLKLFVSLKVDICLTDSKGNNVAHAVADYRNIEKFTQFLEIIQHHHGAAKVLKATNVKGKTPLQTLMYKAHKSGFSEESKLALFLKLQQITTKEVNSRGNNAVLYVISYPMYYTLSIVQALIKAGGDFSFENYHGQNALHVAARNGNTGVVKYLVSLGLSLEKRDHNGLTPLLLLSCQNLEIIECLYVNGADMFASGPLGDNMVHMALRKKDNKNPQALFEFLFKNEILWKLLDMKNLNDQTPVHLLMSVKNNHIPVDMLSQLLDIIGPKINEADKLGFNLFLTAVKAGKSETILQALIEKGADYKVCSASGRTAVHVAVEAKSKNLLCFLFTLDIDLERKDFSGKTALELAKDCLDKYANVKSKNFKITRGIFNMLNEKLLTKTQSN